MVIKQNHDYNIHVKNHENQVRVLEMLLSNSTDESEKQDLKKQILKLRAELVTNVVNNSPAK